MSVNKSNDQIAQSSQDLWSMACAKAGAIFQKGDITHIMRTIFNAPMSPNQFEESLGAGLLPCKGGDEIDDLNACLASLFGGDGASELSHLGYSRPVLLQIAGKC